MNANNEFSKAVSNLVSGSFNNIGHYLKKKTITIDYLDALYGNIC